MGGGGGESGRIRGGGVEGGRREDLGETEKKKLTLHILLHKLHRQVGTTITKEIALQVSYCWEYIQKQ